MIAIKISDIEFSISDRNGQYELETRYSQSGKRYIRNMTPDGIRTWAMNYMRFCMYSGIDYTAFESVKKMVSRG